MAVPRPFSAWPTPPGDFMITVVFGARFTGAAACRDGWRCARAGCGEPVGAASALRRWVPLAVRRLDFRGCRQKSAHGLASPASTGQQRERHGQPRCRSGARRAPTTAAMICRRHDHFNSISIVLSSPAATWKVCSAFCVRVSARTIYRPAANGNRGDICPVDQIARPLAFRGFPRAHPSPHAPLATASGSCRPASTSPVPPPARVPRLCRARLHLDLTNRTAR